MRNKINITYVILLCCFLTVLAGCGGKETEVLRETIWLDNPDGTFTKAEVLIPDNYEKEQLPLVTIAHGFRGNMDSAGGNYLAENLAENGIAAVRVDFSHYTSKDGGEQTGQYTVKTMAEDQVNAVNYMLERYNIDGDRIGLYGRSLGGRTAMIMANENAGGFDYKGMALVAPAGTADAFTYYIGGEDVWKNKRSIAKRDGYAMHQKVKLTPEFFSSIDDYDPSQNGYKFRKPVLVIYNTEDYVVLPKTSKACAAAYEHAEIIEITSEKSPHGCEMGFKTSTIKDQLITSITDFFWKIYNVKALVTRLFRRPASRIFSTSGITKGNTHQESTVRRLIVPVLRKYNAMNQSEPKV